MNQRVAIITGAGRGIGRAVAHRLHQRGFRLAIVSRSESQLSETNSRCGGDALVLPCDVTDPAAADSIVQAAVDRSGRVDVLVHCAGIAPVLAVEQTTPEQWRRIIDTNLSGAFYLCRACWPIFLRQQEGVIVNVSSFAARDPFPGFAAYGAAKAGLNLLGVSLAREGAPHGIRVHTIAPAAVETEMFRKILTREQFPPERTLLPDEVARVIEQCIDGDLRHTSGEVIWLQKKAS